VNSEELEKSLRTEFENHLRNVLAEMRQELDGLQKSFEAEIENHKTRLGEILEGFSARFDQGRELDEGFKSSVVEHLRLARDEGARITAEAISEAEQMEKNLAPAVSFNELRDAVSEISSQNSQAEILKALVNHAAQYVPRGAFFIVKNDYFVGWRAFGKEVEIDDHTVREVYFPISASTVLGESIRSLTTVESSYGTYDDDAVYLEKLEFGQPDRMYAIPLIARGRGVAVLYADYGREGTNVNIEALETMMRVAGLTVELLAASRGSKARSDAPAGMRENAATAESQASESAPQNEDYRFDYQSSETAEASEQKQEPAAADYRYEAEETESFTGQDYSYSAEPQYEYADTAQEAEKAEESGAGYSEGELQPAGEEPSWSRSTGTNGFSYEYQAEDTASQKEEPSPYETTVSQSDYHISSSSGYEFESNSASTVGSEPAVEEKAEIEAPPVDVSRFEQTEVAPPAMEDHTSSTTTEQSGSSFEQQQPESKEPVYAEPVETVSQNVISPQPVKTRFSDRNVDLPIDVSEDERRLHNDARRFARLLVSEIKLYNEQKVNEGRASYDLYERLREAIDRSREMYDKRVQPPVAAKFDYFHYELVHTLAEGDEAKLGGSYPGAQV
jgi:hypothetical protein